MKRVRIFVVLFLYCISYAQICKHDVGTIASSEKQATLKTLALVANPNTQNYNVTYHKLEFTVNPSVNSISGKVTTTFTALANMSTVTFDLSNVLTVSSVKQGTTNLSFVQNANNELVITLPSIVNTGASSTVEITYSGTPTGGGFGSFVKSTHNGTPIIWTLSEPFGARDWWPCKQDLNDKIESIDVYITAPSQYVAVSNGIETTTPVINGSNKTTYFHHGFPIPAYLVAIAVTNYTVYNQTAGNAPNTYPIINYIYPESFNTSLQNQLSVTPSLLNLFSTLFEIYPFHTEKYGHAQFGWGGGMEHTTVSFMVGFDRQLIAHELAHQWFGDKITCATWNDIWLNEGFATYCASLVYENLDDLSTFINDKQSMVNNITSVAGGAVYLTNTEAQNVNRIFDDRLSYNKGAMVLEMLRFKMGDTVFFQGIKNYLADTNLAFNYATTTQFKTHMEAVYGSSLTEFFNDWVYNQGYPSYQISATNTGTNQVTFLISQTQSHSSVSFFEMPLPIRVYGNNGEVQDLVLQNTMNNQSITVAVNFPIVAFDFDPEIHLITKNNTTTLSSQNLISNSSVSIVPNPASTYISIVLPQSVNLLKSTLYTMQGQKVLEENTTTLSINQLSAGAYILEIDTDCGTIHKKVLKN
ncbi:putative secreted protein (Por secretion system target) [Flavobacterium croceum DSM 17960]|uniref:Aminopeptidase N n=1 Tax=Flavobacterium croceum DSM 17960 TaxID=1121886 RepID=A0A2S4NCD9_9FLAO|nr:M1 family aminopeptidase [Flavobacterium croceum]POS03103.1 putative secreted protein (Por secretion system target) [Flavobacterium croceum DSM 17960]